MGSNPLGMFLRAHREMLTPREAGLNVRLTNRRVPGLRREEVAALAGVSVEYLTRLERGKDTQPSAAVLDAIATALRLDRESRRYLHALATPPGLHRTEPAGEELAPALQRALARLEADIAYVLNPYFDVLASTPVAQAILGDAVTVNQVEYLFLDPRATSTYPDWASVANEAVSALRSSVVGRENDERLLALLGRLSTRSPRFAAMWARHIVHGSASGTKRIVSERFGELTVTWDALTPAYPTGQTLVVYTPDTDSRNRIEAVHRQSHALRSDESA